MVGALIQRPVAGRGKLTIAYIPERQEPELMYKLFDKVCCDIEDVIDALK